MTIGDKIWASAVGEVGVEKIWDDPVAGVAELGRLVIREINQLDADFRTDLAAMELHYHRDRNR
jgi:hypothetical protein